MAPLAPFAMLAAAGVSAAGTIASGRAAKAIGDAENRRSQAQGLAAKQAADYEAAQLDIQAKEEMASGQREMLDHRRQKDLALSSLQARAGAGGFSATDPTSLALADEISKYGTMQEQMAMYGGESRSTGLKASAAATRFSGESARHSAFSEGAIAAAAGRAQRNASYFKAAGTILGDVSTMGEKYASRQPLDTTETRYGPRPRPYWAR